jgi:Uma2 family endonuclease
MILALSEATTLEEFLKLPETKPASEYINGQITQKPMPQGKHSTIQTELSTTINVALKPKKLAKAFSELRCTFEGRSIGLDVSVFSWNKIPRDENGEVANAFLMAPDWVIEILSPEQSQTKVTKNILYCLNHGTQLGWLVDPLEQTVMTYLPKQQPEAFDRLEQRLPVPSFAKDLNLTVGIMFGWLLE